MSWSFQCIGKPEAVAAALDGHSSALKDQCKAEFDDALPHLKGILAQNYVTPDAPAGYVVPTIDFEASGSGYAVDGKQVQRSCKVSIQALWKPVV